MEKATSDSKPTYIRGPRLRARWDMSNTTFYRKLAEGTIPKPHFPFGDATPYWSLAEIEAFEAKAGETAGAR